MSDLDRLEALLAQAEARVEDLRTTVRVLRELKGVAEPPKPMLTIRRVGLPPAAEAPAKPNGKGKVHKPGLAEGRLSKEAGKVVSAKLLDILAQHPGSITTKEIAPLAGVSVQQAGQFLNRLRLKGEVTRVEAGRYKPV